MGGFLSSLAAHYFGLMKVFVGAALISLFVAAAWFLWFHLIANSLRIQQKKSCCSCQSFSRRKNRATLDATAVDDVDDFDAPTQFPKGIEMFSSLSLFPFLVDATLYFFQDTFSEHCARLFYIHVYFFRTRPLISPWTI